MTWVYCPSVIFWCVIRPTETNNGLDAALQKLAGIWLVRFQDSMNHVQ